MLAGSLPRACAAPVARRLAPRQPPRPLLLAPRRSLAAPRAWPLTRPSSARSASMPAKSQRAPVVEVVDDKALSYTPGTLKDIRQSKYLIDLGGGDQWVDWQRVREAAPPCTEFIPQPVRASSRLEKPRTHAAS